MIDKDLTFLEQCRNEDLRTLADYLVYDPSDHQKRHFESLSSNMMYKYYYPQKMQLMVNAMSEELSYFGSNDIAYFTRKLFGKHGGVPYREILEDVCKKLKKVISECGINKQISFHCSRHTFGTLALSKGMPIESVSRVLGHTNIKTTQIYAKITTQKLGNDLTAFGNQLNQTFGNIKVAGI